MSENTQERWKSRMTCGKLREHKERESDENREGEGKKRVERDKGKVQYRARKQ